ncbi:MAG TPA: hypothetical protein VGW35_04710 [Methylomirabilota bacterium]|nr:hypothetical protein [Methylomirabilota bacterium]
MKTDDGEKRARRTDAPREVRIPESVFLSRPDLWSREGLQEYLRENGIDPSAPYHREEVFVQLDAAA